MNAEERKERNKSCQHIKTYYCMVTGGLRCRQCKICLGDNGQPYVKEGVFTQAEIETLQSQVYKITGKGEVMMLFNKLLGVSSN